MNLDRMVENLIESAHWRELCNDSYFNFHTEGLTYINLFRDRQLTVKLYLFDDVKLNDQGFLVHPHNHSYNFYHKTLVGQIANSRFTVGGVDLTTRSGTPRWDVWQYDTPLNGGDGVSQVDLQVGLTERREVLCAGAGYYLDHKEIHTIAPLSGDYAAAVLVQYHDVSTLPTSLFVPAGEKPDCYSGLYEPMNHTDAEEAVTRFYVHWQEEKKRIMS